MSEGEEVNLKVIWFDELSSDEQLLPLLDQAFRWTYNPKTFSRLIKNDPRLGDSGVGLCALEGSRIVGNVGVMDLTTRTLDGRTEKIGGIYGVATLPGYTRKGICSTLMKQAHEHFTKRGYRFSLLGTSHTIVAHSLYAKLGYKDLLDPPGAYKLMKQRKSPKPQPKGKAGLDVDNLLRIYTRLARGKAGLVTRDRSHFLMFQKLEGMKAKNCVAGRDGYMLFSEVKQTPWMEGISIREIVASGATAMNRLVSSAETKAKDMVFDRAIMDDRLLQVYRSRGYMIAERSHSVLMVKQLTPGASFRETYGDKFHMTGLDFF